MQLTERDAQIVLAVYKHRFLTTHQIEALCFPSETSRGTRTVCQRRLQLLYHHGFLSRLPEVLVINQGRKPLVYGLDERGAMLVASLTNVDRSAIEWKEQHNVVSQIFLQHTLKISSLLVVVELLEQAGIWRIEKVIGERQFKSADMKAQIPFYIVGARTERAYPDSYLCLHVNQYGQNAHCFIEIDMGTMSNTRWQHKVRAYTNFRSSGQSQTHYGTSRFRVLTITTSDARLQNMKAATEQANGGNWWWFTTFDALDIWNPRALLVSAWQIAGGSGLHSLF